MTEVKFVRGYRNLREGETAGFEDALADTLIEEKIAVLVRRNVPETAGLGGDGLVKTCPHCKEDFVIDATGKVRAERAVDPRMQPAPGKTRQAEARA